MSMYQRLVARAPLIDPVSGGWYMNPLSVVLLSGSFPFMVDLYRDLHLIT